MLRCKSDLFRSSIRFVDVLKKNTKEELKVLANTLGIAVSAKLRKEEYTQYIANIIVLCPNMWLPQLTHYELLLLGKLVKAGPNAFVEEPYSPAPCMLEALSLLITDHDYAEEGKIRYMICDDLREAVAPLLDEVLASPELTNRFRVEPYVCGLLNLYGYLSYTELRKLLRTYLPDSISEREVTEHFTQSALLQWLRFELHEEPLPAITSFRSPFVPDVEELLDQLDARPDITKRKIFSEKEVLQAGSMPLVNAPNPHADEVKTFMIKKLGYTAAFADYKLQMLWYDAQTDIPPMDIILSLVGGKLASMLDLAEAINQLSAYLNACPRWFLKGYTPQESGKLLEKKNAQQRPPHIVPAPFGFDDHKVGRNDPCPCGSGKKYKKCCGGN